MAKYFDEKNAGTIKAGNVADLVLLNGNPLTDISQTANIEGVMIGKKWLSKDSINSALQSLKGRVSQ